MKLGKTNSAALLVLALCACKTTSPEPAEPLRGQVEIFTWWAADESQPLEALLDVYRAKYPQVTVVNSAILGGSGTNAKEELRKRMLANQPPDTFQVHPGEELIDRWVRVNEVDDSASKMLPLDALYDAEGWRTAIHPATIDRATYRGRVYAVPVGIHRHNAFFYNKKIFADNGLKPPTTYEELNLVSDALVAKGITPMALGYKEHWYLTDLFLNVLAGIAGAAYTNAFFAGEKQPTDPEIRATLDEIEKLLVYAGPDGPRLDWVAAARKIQTGAAAMFICGDFAKGYYLSTFDWKPNVDYGLMASPGTARIFIVILDAFGLPKNAPDPENAVALLKVVGSREGQTAFNKMKGSMPARLDVDPNDFDENTRANLAEFASDDHVPALGSAVPTDFNDRFNEVMATFAADHDREAVITFLRTRYSQLKRKP